VRPNEAVKWELIQWARARGFRWLDVGGIARRDALALARDPASIDRSPLKMRLPGVPLLYPEPLQLIKNPVLRQGFSVLGTHTVGSLRRFVEGRLHHGSQAN
jgi:hypothetical protein